MEIMDIDAYYTSHRNCKYVNHESSLRPNIWKWNFHLPSCMNLYCPSEIASLIFFLLQYTRLRRWADYLVNNTLTPTNQ